MDKDDNECFRCPPGTYINTNKDSNKKCIKCSFGTTNLRWNSTFNECDILTNTNKLNTSENMHTFENIDGISNIPTDVIDEVNEEIIKKMYNINLEKVTDLTLTNNKLNNIEEKIKDLQSITEIDYDNFKDL